MLEEPLGRLPHYPWSRCLLACFCLGARGVSVTFLLGRGIWVSSLGTCQLLISLYSSLGLRSPCVLGIFLSLRPISLCLVPSGSLPLPGIPPCPNGCPCVSSTPFPYSGTPFLSLSKGPFQCLPVSYFSELVPTPQHPSWDLSLKGFSFFLSQTMGLCCVWNRLPVCVNVCVCLHTFTPLVQAGD